MILVFEAPHCKHVVVDETLLTVRLEDVAYGLRAI